MPVGSRSVFLSYASEDSEAAARLANALAAAGVEVWFDKNALRGGDAWDRQIRQQIHDCRLFIPIISGNTEARDEGYFRREWKIAVDRTHDMHEHKAFLVPVVIDGMNERDAAVPDKFREMQWTRLPGGTTSSAFVERIKGLLASDPATGFNPRNAAVANDSIVDAPVRSRVRTASAAVAATLLLALGYLALEHIRGTVSRDRDGGSIAVLPLANESDDPGQQYFSDGISEDLISALAQLPKLKVIGRTSAFQFRDSKEDSHAIGEKLGVAHLLEGSVQRSGDTVRVLVQLIDTRDGSTNWSERFDRPYKELFALQDQITLAVVTALRSRFLPNEHSTTQGDRPPSGNLDAYNALLQGRFLYRHNTSGELHEGIGYLAKAIDIDPNYALAWSELGQAWAYYGANALRGEPARQAYVKAHHAVDRALTLAPTLAAAHVGRGFVLMVADLDWRGGEVAFRRALELAPDDAEAQHGLAIALGARGDTQQAIDLMRHLLVEDPLRATSYNWLATYQLRLNQLDEAERSARKSLELQHDMPSMYSLLTSIELVRGNSQAALAAAQRETDPEDRPVAIALARQIGADRNAADAALRALIHEHADDYPWGIARVYALRKDADSMFQWLDRAWEKREPELIYLLLDPLFLPYRSDPRFASFCRRIGLPAPAEPRAQNKSSTT